ncbi:MAG TPA: hypothetical protein VF808_05050 [Ktedonobacterales bacterium]
MNSHTETRKIAPIVFVLDCDNTLLDNDALKRDMDARLRDLLGAKLTDSFWRIYENVRAAEGTVDLPATFAAFRPSLDSDEQLERARSLVMNFPFNEYIYPDTPATIELLKRHGSPVIVSDGDAVYQPGKIIKSGLAQAVDNEWVVYVHKEDHLSALMDRWPANFYVMIDDKSRILASTKALRPDRFVTVHVLQGHYSADRASPAPDITVPGIGGVRDLNFEGLSIYLRQ